MHWHLYRNLFSASHPIILYVSLSRQASPEGQDVFDRLLKACNEVVWKGESILVLNQIQVDPPYGAENCRMNAKSSGGALDHSALERVKKIVAASNGSRQ